MSGVGGRDLGRPHPPLGAALWPGLNSAKFVPIWIYAKWYFPPVKATQGAAGVVFFVFDERAGAILVHAAPKIAPNGPCPGP